MSTAVEQPIEHQTNSSHSAMIKQLIENNDTTQLSAAEIFLALYEESIPSHLLHYLEYEENPKGMVLGSIALHLYTRTIPQARELTFGFYAAYMKYYPHPEIKMFFEFWLELIKSADKLKLEIFIIELNKELANRGVTELTAKGISENLDIMKVAEDGVSRAFESYQTGLLTSELKGFSKEFFELWLQYVPDEVFKQEGNDKITQFFVEYLSEEQETYQLETIVQRFLETVGIGELSQLGISQIVEYFTHTIDVKKTTEREVDLTPLNGFDLNLFTNGMLLDGSTMNSIPSYILNLFKGFIKKLAEEFNSPEA